MTDTLTAPEDAPEAHHHQTLAAAVCAALAELDDPRKDQTATVETRGGGSYSYTYADLASVMGQVRPVLARHGLVVIQPVSADQGWVTVWTKLLHTSGDALVSPPFRMAAAGTPQAVGSAVTYARRYSLLASLGLATEDDDGRGPNTRSPSSTVANANSQRRTTTHARRGAGSDPDRQRALAMSLANELGLGGTVNRDARLERWSQILGREVASWNDLDPAERSRVIDVMRGDLDGGQWPTLEAPEGEDYG